MTTPPNGSPGSRAERRALWEVRQRYSIDQPRRGSSARATASSSAKPPAKPPASGNRRAANGQSPRPRKKHRWTGKIILSLVILACVGGGIFGYKILAASNKISVADQSLLGQLKDLLFASGQQLHGEAEDRINIMLIAVGGEGHSGENLADTIMVASIRPSDNAVALMSIPRDLYVQVPHEQYFAKINSIHAYGEAQKKDNGPALLQEKVEEITGLDIHYYGRIDFVAFKNIIDTLGGVNITIDRSFEDYWHKIAFPAGTEKMNGERALAYARARYVQGPEGGDFKRAARQQQILLAIRDKVFSVNTAFDFGALNSILDSLSDNIRTDMQLWEMKRFYEISRQIDHQAVHSVVLTTGPKGVLTGGTEVLNGVPASILKPRTGDFSEIRSISANIFSDQVSHNLAPTPQTGGEETTSPEITSAETPTPTATPSPAAQKITLEIRNGTNTTGLAQQTSDTLKAEGFSIVGIGNAANRTTETTTVYAIKSTDADAAKTIAGVLDAKSDSGLPANEKETSANILIILGADAN